MYSINDLQDEIRTHVDLLIRSGAESLHPDWVTNSVMSEHTEIDGEDTDFYRIAARMTVRQEVRKCLNAFKPTEDSSPNEQLVLEGFERLQKYYLVNRDGTQVAARIDTLSEIEIRLKISELKSMAAGCLLHADELARYLGRKYDAVA